MSGRETYIVLEQVLFMLMQYSKPFFLTFSELALTYLVLSQNTFSIRFMIINTGMKFHFLEDLLKIASILCLAQFLDIVIFHDVQVVDVLFDVGIEAMIKFRFTYLI